MSLRSLVVVLLAASAASVKVTPIEKVTELLKGLQAKISEEGKKEAAAYDKYACFCKEQADGKLYSIEKSTEKIDKLSADIKTGDAEVAALNKDIGALSTKISGLDDKIDLAEKARAKDNAKYLARAKDLSEAIDSCKAAIETMKDAKGGLKDAKVNLVEIRSLVEKLKKQAPAKYEFQGNDIIAVLEDLLSNFKQEKAEMDRAEFDVNSLFEKERLGDQNERQFAQQEKDEKAALAESTNEDVMNMREANDAEKADRKADQAFLDTLTVECEDKAKLFDQRSGTRADELTAMTGAIAELEKGVKDNEGANKKLVGLVQGDMSFVQIKKNSNRGTHTLQENSNRAVKRVQELLQDAAGRLDSSVLSGAAMRVQLSADHFVKVRGLINDLIKKLKADAAAEADQKSFCDKAMKKAITNRDTGSMRKENQNAKIASLTAEKEDLIQNIADLNEAIAANKKALQEAQELRTGEKEDNEETVISATEGERASNAALTLLSKFYTSNAFAQTSKFVPKNSDKDGNTVGDLAPETFDEEYKGAQGESKGVMGILEVIVSDFQRTIKQTNSDEKDAAKAFDELEKENNKDTKAKSDDVDKKEGKLKSTKANIIGAQNDLQDATDLFDSGIDKLDELKSACVDGAETWEERAAARKKEIEALKEAQTVLDEWQGGD